MINLLRSGRWLARVAAVGVIVVLVCVPALTRVGQRLETSSHAPSFAKNIDCPPKKVTVAPTGAMTSPLPLDAIELVPIARFAPSVAQVPRRPPQFESPAPLRAPPVALLA